ncbi:MAG: DUF366 family protein [bacterium]
MPANTYLFDGTLKYTGEQLRSHFALTEFGIEGDSIVAFRGPCEIEGCHIVDMDEVIKGERIYSPDMLHFITEIFGPDMNKAILVQRIITTIIIEQMIVLKGNIKGLLRKGNDIYIGDGKLSISVATVSPVSNLIHHGLNICKEGVSFPITCLEEIGVDNVELAILTLKAVENEYTNIERATRKVRWVR